MEKSATVIGNAAAVSGARDLVVKGSVEEPKDHLKVWREIYQDVRRQWAEAESSSLRSGRFGK
ncbi:MAG: hypothetical protein RRA15_11620 [bacterium]|nr:hypothetical protein [bacterium]MDT8367114.1 hypothetical protein [bacterium]